MSVPGNTTPPAAAVRRCPVTDKLRVRDHRRPGWFWVYNELLTVYGQELAPYGIAVYCALAMHADNTDQSCYPSYATIARETGMSRAQVKRELRKLEAIGLIQVEHRGDRRRPNIYHLLSLKEHRPLGSGRPQTRVRETLALGSGRPPNYTQITRPNNHMEVVGEVVSEAHQMIMAQLIEFSIQETTAERLATEYPSDVVESKIRWYTWKRERGDGHAPGPGFLVRAIEEDWTPDPAYLEAQELEEERRGRYERYARLRPAEED